MQGSSRIARLIVCVRHETRRVAVLGQAREAGPLDHAVHEHAGRAGRARVHEPEVLGRLHQAPGPRFSAASCFEPVRLSSEPLQSFLFDPSDEGILRLPCLRKLCQYMLNSCSTFQQNLPTKKRAHLNFTACNIPSAQVDAQFYQRMQGLRQRTAAKLEWLHKLLFPIETFNDPRLKL